ncbi:hypothetical protein ACIQPR_46200 [Streptomyces sp. NPDC091280]|uniref:hypothetical protein n=1 Tax=Streptomyces sp. NPDC091280 TaxID=3365984 RepID=UPI0037F5E7D5
MSDEISDGTVDVAVVLTEQIEARFGLSMEQMKAAVAAAPDANPDATDIVHWHGLLLESQTVLDRAEHDLMVVLEAQPDPVADRTHALVRRVEAAVVARDGRAQALRWYLDPAVPVQQGLAADPRARIRAARRGPAVPTSAPPRPADAPQAAKGVKR